MKAKWYGDAMKEKIARSQASDADVLTAIAIAAKKHWGYSDEQIEKWREEMTVSEEDIKEDIVFHLEKEGKIVGFYSLSKEDESFEIEHLWILPEYIGQGLGKILFEHARETAVQNGARHIRAESDPNAEGFYLKMGMKRTGEKESSIPGRMLPVLEITL